jgi:hypothetical protein
MEMLNSSLSLTLYTKPLYAVWISYNLEYSSQRMLRSRKTIIALTIPRCIKTCLDALPRMLLSGRKVLTVWLMYGPEMMSSCDLDLLIDRVRQEEGCLVIRIGSVYHDGYGNMTD